MFKSLIILILGVLLIQCSQAQFLMDMVDTSKDIGKGLLSIYQKFDRVRIGGYIQPQFQWAEHKGEKSYNGGDFAENVNNRFMIRRGRIRFDYIHFAEKTGPNVQFVFQFDGTERGVFIRDFWGRIFENKLQLFGFTAGMFARPFSYELNLSSSDRETPERGRMSQILMRTERDLGIMLSFDARKKDHPMRYFKFDVGLFNGQGLTAASDFDSHKDLISRLALKPVKLSQKIILSTAVSYLNGGFLQNSIYTYRTEKMNGFETFVVDSSVSNKGNIVPRKYYGADVQLKYKTKAGFTEIRGEYIFGTQTASHNSTETPGALLNVSDGYYIRKFNGAYFYLLHNFIDDHHQLVIKYDWYDPNTEVDKHRIGNAASNLNATDIKFSTLGFGYNYYMNPNVKLLFYYEVIQNENTMLPGFTSDIKDDVFTCRLQFRF